MIAKKEVVALKRNIMGFGQVVMFLTHFFTTVFFLPINM